MKEDIKSLSVQALKEQIIKDNEHIDARIEECIFTFIKRNIYLKMLDGYKSVYVKSPEIKSYMDSVYIPEPHFNKFVTRVIETLIELGYTVRMERVLDVLFVVTIDK